MRSDKLFCTLLAVSFLVVLLCVPVLADSETHQPTLIIPTKFRYLLMDLVQSAGSVSTSAPVPTAAPTPVPTPTPVASSSAAVTKEDSGMAEEALLAALTPDQSYSGFGRGSVSTFFDVNFEEQGRKIDNRERLTARGLFNVHVSHELN